MADDKDFQKDEDSSRVSVRFLVDNQPYNAGESAVFHESVAAKLAQLNVVKINKHPVKNDSNLLALINGDNNDMKSKGGMNEQDIAALIDKKLDEKLKPLLDELSKKDDTGPKSPLAPAVKK